MAASFPSSAAPLLLALLPLLLLPLLLNMLLASASCLFLFGARVE